MTYIYKDYAAEMVAGLGRVYLTDSGPYPSITTILGHTVETEKKSVLDNWRARVGNKEADRISNAAANRGTNVHLMLERALNGEDPKVFDFPKEHGAIFNSLKLEIRKITKVTGQEVVLYSDMLGVAGRCDLVGEYQGEPAIIDYKTSSRVKSADEIGDYWLQTAAYLLCNNEMTGSNITKMVILMGVENRMPMVFKKTINDDIILQLITRINAFYAKL